MVECIPFTRLAATPWANGAGRKADIATDDGWTLAFAWLDGPAPFSDYTGFTRTITLVEGDGFALDFAERPAITVARIGAPATFDGGWPAQCRLLGGPCLVLNAYSAQGRWRHAVRVVEPRGAGPLRAGDFVVVLRGQVWVGGVAGGARDSLRIGGPAAASGSVDALVAVVRFDPG
ncbi:MAG: hypothetical protein BGP12_00595 [Rhodospirillales bacterium 70-18]|nr:HutD family protein [Rhodospirillales bacterium]OJY78378.1 MAG: hypothetical protein BGP12_00595 [Rhodospirillales bacterium 70-18]